MAEKNRFEPNEDDEEGSEPIYTIGVVSRLLNCEPSTLRRYENAGLVNPSRTEGNTRLFSNSNLETLRKVHKLIEEGKLNAHGARMVLELQKDIYELNARVSELEAKLKELRETRTPE